LLATEKERTGFPFPNHPRPLFRDIVRGEISANNLKSALEEKKIRYCPATVDLFTGKIEYKEANDENIIDLVIASTAIPIAMDSVDITQKGEVHSFVDGGTRDVAPLSHAVRENYTNLACIVCQSPQVKELGDFQARKLASLMGRLMNIVINETVNNDLLQIDLIKGLLKRGAYLREELPPPLRVYFDLKCVTVIRPSVELELDDMNFTPTDIEDTIKLGINAATKLFKKPKVFATLAEATSQSEGSGSYILCW